MLGKETRAPTQRPLGTLGERRRLFVPLLGYHLLAPFTVRALWTGNMGYGCPESWALP
jgi:hypothetical protein